MTTQIKARSLRVRYNKREVLTAMLFLIPTMVLLVGFLGAFLAALLTVKALIGFVKKHSFRLFAFYRIILAFVFWFFLGR